MRRFALALLLISGCSPEDSATEPLPKPGRALKRDTCPGNHCWGIHSFEPSSNCDRCGAGGQATAHHLCKSCAEVQGRCQHCSGKLPEPKAETPPPVDKKETPPPPPEPAPPPVEKKEPPPPPEPKGALPKPSQDLAVEEVDLSGDERQNHSVLVFAASADRARLALEAHRSRKEKVISELPGTKAGAGAGLYLVWGHFPMPTLEGSDVRAAYDEKSGLVRVTLPPWTRYHPKRGIGMDWGVDRARSWTFIGFRVKLESLPAGEYSFEVAELSEKETKVLSSGKFELKKD